MDVLGKRIENPVDYQSEGTKLIYPYSGGTYGGTLEVRTIEVLAYGMIEVLAHGARMTYGRLPMDERAARASSEHRTSSE